MDTPQKPRHPWVRWAVLAVVLAGLGTLATFYALHWPYSERMVIPSLQDTFKTKVTFTKFRRFYFPNPGCEIEGLTLASRERNRPLVQAQKMTITGRYTDLVTRPHHLANIRLEGLYVRVPERSKSGGFQASGESESKVSVGSATADGAVLEIVNNDGEARLKFDIQKLTVTAIAAGKPMSYAVHMKISDPAGDLESTGAFGPWQSGKLENTPLHGSVKLSHASLDQYAGIAGSLHSTETFNGRLDEMQVIGEAASPDFELKTAKHKIAVFSRFQVIVNAMKGELYFKDVTGKIGQTPVKVTGNIAKNAKLGRRETQIAFAIDKGRAQDLLWLFNSAKKPPLMGDAKCSGHVLVTKFGPGFMKNLTVTDGKFQVLNGHFQEKTQLKTNELSARALGKKIKDASEAPDVGVTNLSGDVAIEKGVAHLSMLYFEVPGARARMDGTYNFENDQVNLHGNLWTNASVSDDTSGIKSVLLEPFDPLFRRKHAGAMVAVSMTGKIDAPVFGTMLTKKKTAWTKNQKPEETKQK
jgi:hypothetical protein